MGDGCTTQFQRKGKTVLRICFLIILKPLIQMVDAVAISANNIYIRQSGKIAFLLNENIDICKTIRGVKYAIFEYDLDIHTRSNFRNEMA